MAMLTDARLYHGYFVGSQARAVYLFDCVVQDGLQT